MSMFSLTGRVIHIYDAPGRRDKEKKIEDDDYPKVQIFGVIPLRNGQFHYGLVDLKCSDPALFRQYLGQDVNVPIGFFAAGRNQGIHYIPEGCKPVAVGDVVGSVSAVAGSAVASSAVAGSVSAVGEGTGLS